MGRAPASGESSRGGSPSPIKGQSSTQCGRSQSGSRRARRARVCRSWRSERSRRRGEESQSEALETTVDGTVAELGGPGEWP